MVTRAQLVGLVEQALGRADGDSRAVVLVHADPADLPVLEPIRGHTVEVRGSRSPLEIRSLLQEGGSGALVVLTTCTPSELGDDVLARATRSRIERVDRWQTVCRLFGTERPSPELARRSHLADALIEAAPADGYPRLVSRVLDLDSAVGAILRTAVGLPDAVDDLAGLLRWADRAETAGRLTAARASLAPEIDPVLRARFGSGVDAVLAAVAAGRAGELVPLGVVAGVVHAEVAADDDVDAGAGAAAVRIDERLGAPHLQAQAYRDWGRAAKEVVALEERAQVTGWLERSGTLLAELGAGHLAHRSDLLPQGFTQRIAQAAAVLAAWHGDRDGPGRADAARSAVERVATHDDARLARDRVERLRMVARLLRRRDLHLVGLDDLATAAVGYEVDGGWLDAARTVVSRGDVDPVLAALCARLTAEADEARVADGRAFATGPAARQAAAGPLPASTVGVEEILDRVVVPLAVVRPVIVVVLDGLGWATFTELVPALEGAGWTRWRRSGPDAPGQVGIAALPTITEVSRTSLFAGTCRRGDDGSERRAFAGHPGLRTVTGAGPAPALFHKRDLRAGGLDTLPQGLLDAVADERNRVVGVVINNIDERLKDVAQPGDGWELRDLDPLRFILDEARRVGRTVVVAADHGHVLDRDAEARPAGGGGERWRPVSDSPEDGEVVVHGPRVVANGQQAVLPWLEQLRYGPRRNGYHGGLTPRELFVPVAVLAADDPPEGSAWEVSGFLRPAWWRATALPVPEPVRPIIVAEPPTSASAAAPTLFDPPGDPADWLDDLFASPSFVTRRANPRVRLSDDHVRRLLRVLDATRGTAVLASRLAEAAALPVARIDRYVAQLQELVNVDGYGVVSTANGEVRLDRALLDRQFGL